MLRESDCIEDRNDAEYVKIEDESRETAQVEYGEFTMKRKNNT